VPVTGLLEHSQGLAEMVASPGVRSPGLGCHPEVKERIGFPAWVAESLGKGECPLEMVCGLLVLAEFAAQNADHEIGVGYIAAAFD
jgi:hypothetical protein